MKTGLQNRIPYKFWTGSSSNLSYSKIFGNVFPKKSDINRIRNLEKSIFIGYPKDVNGHRLYDLDTHTITTSRDMIFMNENNECEASAIEVKENDECQK